MRRNIFNKKRLRQTILAGLNCEFLEYQDVELTSYGKKSGEIVKQSFSRKQSEVESPPINIRTRVWNAACHLDEVK
jgi:hypothetical protein